MTARLENWKCLGANYAAPEVNALALIGTVYDHPTARHFDGKEIQTSRVMSADGRTVQTRNTTYELGEADPDFVQWMEDNDIKFDPENPITLKG